MKRNPDKTEVLLVASSSVLECGCTARLGEVALATPKPSTRSLAIFLVPRQLFHEQISTVAKNAHLILPALADTTSSTPSWIRKTLLQLLMPCTHPGLDYCNALCMGQPLKTGQKLQWIQNQHVTFSSRDP